MAKRAEDGDPNRHFIVFAGRDGYFKTLLDSGEQAATNGSD